MKFTDSNSVELRLGDTVECIDGNHFIGKIIGFNNIYHQCLIKPENGMSSFYTHPMNIAKIPIDPAEFIDASLPV